MNEVAFRTVTCLPYSVRRYSSLPKLAWGVVYETNVSEVGTSERVLTSDAKAEFTRRTSNIANKNIETVKIATLLHISLFAPNSAKPLNVAPYDTIQ